MPESVKTQHFILDATFYTGPSMNPTLKASDVLEIIPYGDSKIKCGDVIVFISPNDKHKVTHRIISISKKGIETKGDHNKHIDPYLLTRSDVIGRVKSVKRNNRIIRIYGGITGRLQSKIIQLINYADRIISFLIHPVYLLIIKSGIIRKLLKTDSKLRIINIEKPNSTELKLMFGKKSIGYYNQTQNKWVIRRPYRIFVDEKSLPNLKSNEV
ncbi:signal peptidase I [bacterium]|nr:signal peptidase I [bacterium]